MSKKVNTKIDIEELKSFIKHIVNNNRYLQEKGIIPVTVNVEGDAGLGKTSTISQVAEELGLNFVRLNLATIEELGDLVGFPLRQYEMCKTVSSGTTTSKKMITETVTQMVTEKQKVKVTKQRPENRQVVGVDGKLVTRSVMVPYEVEEEVDVDVPKQVTIEKEVEVTNEATTECFWVDEAAVNKYEKEGYSFTGNNRMSYCPPEWISNLSGGGILLLDDYSRADVRFLQACMTLIETQKYISWSLPKDWHIILTTNPDNGEYLVTPMDVAQKTRFISVELKFNIEIWAKWAEKTGIDGRCINFLLMHPELVTEKVNARAITTFFNSISSIPDFAEALDMIKMVGDGSVGSEFSTMFVLFINNRLDKLITPKQILFDKDETVIKAQLQACIGTGDKYRADIASILTTRVINYVMHYAQDNTISEDLIKRMIMLCTEEGVFTDDLRYLITKKVVGGNRVKFQKMMANNAVLDMVSR